MSEVMKRACSICGGSYDGVGHNPEPFDEFQNRCCNDCNDYFVTPVRIRYGRGTSNVKLLGELRILAQAGRFVIDSRKMVSVAHAKAKAREDV